MNASSFVPISNDNARERLNSGGYADTEAGYFVTAYSVTSEADKHNLNLYIRTDIDKHYGLAGAIAGGNKEEAKKIVSKMDDIDVNKNLYPSGKTASISGLERNLPSNEGCNTLAGWAITNNQYDLYKEIIKNPDYNDQNCALSASLSQGKESVFTDLLEAGISPNANYSGYSVLQIALQNGYTKEAEILLDKGADTDFTLALVSTERNKDTEYVSPLEYVVAKNMTALYEPLLDKTTPEEAGKLLTLQQENGQLDFELFKLVDEKTGYVENLSEEERRLFALGLLATDSWNFEIAIGEYTLNNDQIIAYFFEKDYLPLDTKDEDNLPILYTATNYAYPETVKTLLNKGIDPNSRFLPDKNDNTEKIIGYQNFTKRMVGHRDFEKERIKNYYSRSEKILNSFIDSGIDLKKDDEDLKKIIEALVNQEKITLLGSVLDKSEFDINSKLNEYHTSLDIASLNGKVNSVRTLLEKNANISNKALFADNTFENPEILKMFIDQGADVNSVKEPEFRTDKNQETLLIKTIQTVSEDSVVSLVKLLLEEGADPNIINPTPSIKTKFSSLNSVIHKEMDDSIKLELIEMLVENGADVNLCLESERRRGYDNKLLDVQYVCPLATATYADSRSDIVTYLESEGAKCNDYEKTSSAWGYGYCTQKP